MNKEAQVCRLEDSHRQIISRLDRVQQPQNWVTDPNKVAASLELTVEEAIILADIARLKKSFPHMIAAMECLDEARSIANQRLVSDISKQAIVASLRYPRYVDGDADKELDLGKMDTPFNRFATVLRSVGKIVRIKLGLDFQP